MSNIKGVELSGLNWIKKPDEGILDFKQLSGLIVYNPNLQPLNIVKL